MANEKALIPLADYDAACDAIRDKLYEETTYTSAELGPKIASIDTGKLTMDEYIDLDEYEYDIQAYPQSLAAAWTRPATWPNLDAMTLSEDELWLTVRNTKSSDFLSVKVTCTSNYYVECGKIENDTFTVLESAVTVASGVIYTNGYDSTLPSYLVYHIYVPDDEAITYFGFDRMAGLDGTNYLTNYCNSCLERYAYLPNVTNLSTSSNSRFTCYMLEHEYLKGITTTCTNLNSAWTYGINLRKIEFVNCDFSNVTTMYDLFCYCRVLHSVDLRNLGLTAGRSVYTDTQYMFQYCPGLREIITDNTVKIYSSNARAMFQGCTSLPELDLSWLDLSHSTMMNSMFDGCLNLREIEFDSATWDVCTSASSMFSSCVALTEIDLSNLTTNAITALNNMFAYCYQLESVDLRNLDTSLVTNFSSMFYSCYRLKTVRLDNFEPSVATTLASMFQYCYNLTTLNLGSDATKHSAPLCTTVSSMFNSCYKLKSLTLDGLNLIACTNVVSMFAHCRELEYLSLKDLHFTALASVTYTGSSYGPMFYQCLALREVHLDGLNPGTMTNLYYRTSSGATNYNNIFYDCRYLQKITCNNCQSATLASFNWIGANAGLNENLKEVELKNMSCTSASFSLQSLFSNAYNLKSVDFGTASGTKPVSIYGTFQGCWSLTSITGLNTFDYSACTSAYGTFESCRSLATLDFSIANLTAVTRMDSMFANCYSLATLDLSSWTMGSACTQINSMFANCYKLRTVTLTAFACGSGCTRMDSMFSNCYNLQHVYWPNMSTAYVQNFSFLFTNCWNLVDVDLSHFNTARGTNFNSMFQGCRSIEEIDASTFTSSTSAHTMSSMFYDCWNLKDLDISNMTGAAATTAASMFYNCYSLANLDISTLTLKNCTTINSMFANCKNLLSLDLTHFDMTKIAAGGINGLFSGCENIESIDMRNAVWTAMTTANPGFLPNHSRINYLRIGQPSANFSIAATLLLTRECLLEILDDLPTNTSTKTLKIGAGNMAKLTAAERTAISTNKLWTISV